MYQLKGYKLVFFFCPLFLARYFHLTLYFLGCRVCSFACYDLRRSRDPDGYSTELVKILVDDPSEASSIVGRFLLIQTVESVDFRVRNKLRGKSDIRRKWMNLEINYLKQLKKQTVYRKFLIENYKENAYSLF